MYTVSNSNNEFVLISDPNGLKSIGLLCFRKEDAESFLAQVNSLSYSFLFACVFVLYVMRFIYRFMECFQVRSRKGEVRGHTRVVPITLDQVIIS